MQFQTGVIADVLIRSLTIYEDHRGWLCELFRDDELPVEYRPVMAYVSSTLPGVARGPHEHVEQADCFCFIGPSDFELRLWDNRKASPSYRIYQREVVGQSRPALVVIPPGVVHGYRNIGSAAGLVFNCPNRLYRGPERKLPVDEIRHEDDPQSPFRMD